MAPKRRPITGAAVFQLVSVAGAVALFISSEFSLAPSGDAFSIAMFYQTGFALPVFMFAMPLAVSFGYFSKQDWAWVAHAIKTGGIGYSALSFLPVGVSSWLWPWLAFTVLLLFIDAFFLAAIGPNPFQSKQRLNSHHDLQT